MLQGMANINPEYFLTIVEEGTLTRAAQKLYVSQSSLSQYLKQRRLSVGTLILTHLHSDHAGGAQALLDERIPVARCFYPDGGREMVRAILN